MRKLLTILYVIIGFAGFANMANPVMSGTLGSQPFVNDYVDVVHENLYIKIDEKFNTARFDVEYFIDSEVDGVKIPFLFYASEYLDSFVVEIDDIEVEIKDVPDELNDEKFSGFASFFDPNESAIIKESSHNGFSINLNDMLFFETDISKGKHKIKVHYIAQSWVDGWDEVNVYSFRYALSPAKYWKSFGTLDLTIDASAFNESITSNLRQDYTGSLDAVSHWHFDELPVDVIEIYPQISVVGKVFKGLGAFGLSMILLFVSFVLHVFGIKYYREIHPTKKFSWVLIGGVFLIPILFILGCVCFHSVVDYFIGDHASRRHGYTVLVVVFYPVVLLVYWILAWSIDKFFKNKFRSNKISQDELKHEVL